MISSITNADQLRKMLAECESKIEKLAYCVRDGEEYFVISNNQEIRSKMEERAMILDRLFELHFNDDDHERLSKANAMLETYEQILFEKHIDMYGKLQAVDMRYSLKSAIEYWHDNKNPQLEPLTDDAFYGSRWNRMLDVLNTVELVDSALFECDDNGYTPYTDGWRVYSNASFPMAPDIKLCYTFWELNTYKAHSIPDVLQMTTYKYRQEALLLGGYMPSLNQESENNNQSPKP